MFNQGVELQRQSHRCWLATGFYLTTFALLAAGMAEGRGGDVCRWLAYLFAIACDLWLRRRMGEAAMARPQGENSQSIRMREALVDSLYRSLLLLSGGWMFLCCAPVASLHLPAWARAAAMAQFVLAYTLPEALTLWMGLREHDESFAKQAAQGACEGRL